MKRENNKRKMKEVDQPLVSIIVITYNSSKYVLETLESVRKQTYRNIELIISDDYSLDNTITICHKWVKSNKDRFVRTEIISAERNTGIPSNCNRGVKKSQGEWVKLIAGDDILLESCIEDNIEFVNENLDVKFVISELLEINDNGCLIYNHKEKREKNNWIRFYFNAKTAQKQLKAYARWPVFLNAPTYFLNRQLLEDIDYFDEEYKIFEDMPLMYRVNSNGTVIYFMSKPTVKYRIHDKAISRKLSINDDRDKEVLSIFKKYREEHLSKFNLIDLSIYYELWLNHSWKGYNGHRGSRFLGKLSLFYWYSKYIIYKLEKLDVEHKI